MRIGQVADAAGVSVDTIRFYERRGVLPEPRRRPSGYRVYTEDTVDRIRLARTLQANGFTLDEVIDAAHAFDDSTTCAAERWRLERSVERIDRRIAELRAVRSTVQTTLAACDDGSCQLVRPTAGGQV